MSVSGGIITAPIYAEDPYNLLGVPKQPSGYDVGYIGSNKHGRINWLSAVKPCNLTDIYANKQRLYTNPSMVESRKSIQGFSVKCYDYKPPQTHFRLSDFDGYNHNSYMKVETNNITLDTTQQSASFPVSIRLPGMLLTYIVSGSDGIIRITKGIYGTSDFKEIVGTADLFEMSDFDVNKYVANLSDKTITIQCKQTIGLPANGITLANKLYVSINGGYIVSPDDKMSHVIHNITRPRSYDPSRPQDYRDIFVALILPADVNSVAYDYITILTTPDKLDYVRVKDLQNKMTGHSIVIKYKSYYKKTWTDAVEISSDGAYTLGTGITWYETPYANTGSTGILRGFVFKRSTGNNNDYITDLAITGYPFS